MLKFMRRNSEESRMLKPWLRWGLVAVDGGVDLRFSGRYQYQQCVFRWFV